MAATFEMTVDNERLLSRLKEHGKVPSNIEYLTGVKLFETVDEEGTPGLSVILGPLNTGRRGRKPQAISLSSDPENRPNIRGQKLYRADVSEENGTVELVKQRKEGVALRIITTGLLTGRDGSTTEDFQAIAASGRKLRYHGVFPVTYDAAELIAEGIDANVTSQSRIVGDAGTNPESRVISDERFGRINGLVGIPKQRAVKVEGVIGGPILVGQIDGVLKLHELTLSGWKVHDVTHSEYWQKKFMDLAMKDVEYLAAIENDKKFREKKFKSIKAPPSDHMDA